MGNPKMGGTYLRQKAAPYWPPLMVFLAPSLIIIFGSKVTEQNVLQFLDQNRGKFTVCYLNVLNEHPNSKEWSKLI